MLNGFKMGYSDEHEYYVRVIRAIMSMCPKKAHLDPKTIVVLALMCIVAARKDDYNDTQVILDEMAVHGIGMISADTLRNYRVKMRKGAWLTNAGLNSYLRKAIDDGGIGFGIFYQPNGKGKQ